jgi:hypothetical protein
MIHLGVYAYLDMHAGFGERWRNSFRRPAPAFAPSREAL